MNDSPDREAAPGLQTAGPDPEAELLESALQATVEARAASNEAAESSHEAARAERRAEDARAGAEQARAGAESARDAADAAAQEATEAALEADELLLDEQAQRVAAQVTEEQPFGVPGQSMSRRGLVRVGFALTFGGLLAFALGATILALQQELLLLVTAAFIAIGLEPAVSWLSRHNMRRGFAVLIISLVSVGVVGAFLAVAVPPLVNEASQLVKQAPQFFQELQDKHTFVGHLNAKFHIQDKLTAAASDKLSLNSVGGLLSIGQAILSFTFEVLVVLVLVLYFLADFPGIKKSFYRLAPLPRRPRVALLGDEILSRTGGYILGNLLTSLIAIICQYVILRILGVPFALALSVFVGILDLVPLVGSTIAGVLVTLVALAGVSLTAAIINVVFTILYRLAEDYIISPRILKRTVDVRPVVTIVAVLLGGSLLGIIGALIAVPTAAAIQLIVTEVIYPRMDAAEHPDSLAASQ
ncbi:MAG TPA: AI-2E family transporter [Jatrophihabitans sp.]|nr:AI-2E family transporter [Jatrophihabitans sp.]